MITIEYTSEFKRNLRLLAKRYRSIQYDIEPIITELQLGKFPGEQIKGTGFNIYKVRVGNRDSQRGKSGGYRIIYYQKCPV